MQQLCEDALPKTARAQCDATRRRSDADEPLGGPIHPLRTSLGPPCIISPTHTANLYLVAIGGGAHACIFSDA